MLRITAIIAGVVTLAMIVLAFIGGIFDSAELSLQKTGPYNLIYKEHRGQYSGIRAILNDVFRYAVKEKKGRILQGFAIFYDDPAKVPSDSLRCIAGVITDSLKDVSAPYKSYLYPETEAVVGVFPIRSFLSYTSGTYKFYPQLQKYLSENKITQAGPVLEIYDSSKRTITYIAPINKNPAPEFGN